MLRDSIWSTGTLTLFFLTMSTPVCASDLPGGVWLIRTGQDLGFARWSCDVGTLNIEPILLLRVEVLTVSQPCTSVFFSRMAVKSESVLDLRRLDPFSMVKRHSRWRFHTLSGDISSRLMYLYLNIYETCNKSPALRFDSHHPDGCFISLGCS